ncbi:hypothetical protein BGX31_005101 [Mortierella sp. GBA43]|nr:hypothetical protein BGX31_005101 [Mortierella sp. GBA43]
MDHEHPVVTLTFGTLKANTERAGTDPGIAKEVIKVLQDITQLAATAKRKAQSVIGRYVQQISTGPLSTMDIELLNAICPPFKESEDENDDDPEVDAAKPSPKYEAAKYKAELSTIGWTICNCDYQADTREISKKLKAKVDKGTLNGIDAEIDRQLSTF